MVTVNRFVPQDGTPRRTKRFGVLFVRFNLGEVEKRDTVVLVLYRGAFCTVCICILSGGKTGT